VKVNIQRCWDIVLSQKMLDSVKCVVDDNFVVQRNSALVHLAFNAVPLRQCKTLDFLSLSYGLGTLQSFNPPIMRFRESYSS